MNRIACAALVLLAVGCGGKAAPGGGAPQPVTPKPNIDPGRLEPGREMTLRYPTSAQLHFALDRRDSVAAQMPGGEWQVQTVGRTAFLSVTLTPGSPDTRVAIAVDSVRPNPDATFFPPGLDSAVGTHWTARLPAGGSLTDLTPDRHSLAGDQIGAQLPLLFPTLPAGGARTGAEWTDSSSRTFKVSAFDVTDLATTAYRAEGVTAKGLVISASRRGTLSGAGTQFGQSVDVAGTSIDSLTYLFSPDGRLLHADGSGSTDMTVTVSSVGQTVPVRQMSQMVVELYK